MLLAKNHSAVSDYSLPPYIRDGLIALYDGIKNRSDIGHHCVTSRVWSDLIGYNDLILDPTSYFDQNSLVITTKAENDYSSYGAEVISGNWPLNREFFQNNGSIDFCCDIHRLNDTLKAGIIRIQASDWYGGVILRDTPNMIHFFYNTTPRSTVLRTSNGGGGRTTSERKSFIKMGLIKEAINGELSVLTVILYTLRDRVLYVIKVNLDLVIGLIKRRSEISTASESTTEYSPLRKFNIMRKLTDKGSK